MGGHQSTVPFDYEAQLVSDTVQQSTEVGEETKGETRPRRWKDQKELAKYPFPEEKGGHKTIWECFQRGVQKFPKNNCLGTRVYELDDKKQVKPTPDGPQRGPYVWESYEAVDRLARAFGSGLLELGCKAKDNIGIWSINRAEWVIASLAFYSQNMRTVSLYATLGDDAVEYILNHAEIRVVVVEKENVAKMVKLLGTKVKGVEVIIQFDPSDVYRNVNDTVDEKMVKACAEQKVKLMGFSEVVKLGEAKAQFPNPAGPDDLAFIMYTSGTTGVPKGALLLHSNIVALCAAVPTLLQFNDKDVHVSYLPLAHIFETVAQVNIMIYGGSIGFFQGNVKQLTNDFIALQPTILVGVPRVFSRIYQRIFGAVEEKSCLAKWYFHKAYNTQCTALRNGTARDTGYDAKVFTPIRNRVGLAKCRCIVTGAAPCPAYLLEFLKVITGATVSQGYGMTESAAATSIALPNDRNVGHVGPPLPCNEVKLADVPEMNYLSTDKPYPRGEILVRGPNVFAGYYKNEKATAETLVNGWLCTGDIGRFNPNGSISILDRKKNIFKLSIGEYIAAEKIEAVYAKCPLVGQVWIYGNSYKSTLLAVVVPAADQIHNICQEKGWWPTPKDSPGAKFGSEQFIADFNKVLTGEHAAELKAIVLKSMQEQEKPLKTFEKVKDILIESKIDATGAGFTEANECLTPTFKLRRPFLLARYMKDLKAMYAKNEEPDKEGEKWPGEA